VKSPSTLAQERAKVVDIREKLVHEKVLRKQQQANTSEMTRHLIQAERSSHQLEIDNRKLTALLMEADEKFVTLDNVRASQVAELTDKLQEAETHLAAMMNQIRALESDLGEEKVQRAHDNQVGQDKLMEVVMDRDKAVAHCDMLVHESEELHRRRADLIHKLDEEARRRVQAEATAGDLDCRMRVVAKQNAMLETKAQVQQQQRQQAEAILEAMKRDMEALKMRAEERCRKLEIDNRNLSQQWSEAEQNYESIYKLQQQEINHLTLKLQAARMARLP